MASPEICVDDVQLETADSECAKTSEEKTRSPWGKYAMFFGIFVLILILSRSKQIINFTMQNFSKIKKHLVKNSAPANNIDKSSLMADYIDCRSNIADTANDCKAFEWTQTNMRGTSLDVEQDECSTDESVEVPTEIEDVEPIEVKAPPKRAKPRKAPAKAPAKVPAKAQKTKNKEPAKSIAETVNQDEQSKPVEPVVSVQKKENKATDESTDESDYSE